MKIIKPTRVSHTYTQRLVGEPAVVFPLLCPVREADWIEGWSPTFVASISGVAEPDAVFVTAASPSDAIWYITRHEPEKGFVEMLKITPQVTACRLTIQVRAAGAGSEAVVTYTHTSLGPEGDTFVASFTEEYYGKFMRDWEARLNHYLTHGSALHVAGGSREPQPTDDGVLLSEGRAALRERLGVLGSLRFLRLISGQSDRFEDLRKDWEDLSEEELFARPKPVAPAQR